MRSLCIDLCYQKAFVHAPYWHSDSGFKYLVVDNITNDFSAHV